MSNCQLPSVVYMGFSRRRLDNMATTLQSNFSLASWLWCVGVFQVACFIDTGAINYSQSVWRAVTQFQKLPKVYSWTPNRITQSVPHVYSILACRFLYTFAISLFFSSFFFPPIFYLNKRIRMEVFSWVTLRRGISLYRNCWLKRMHFHISHVYVCRAWMSLSRRWRWSQTNDAASVISIRNEMRCVFSPRREGWGVWRRTYQSNHPTEKWNQIPIQIYTTESGSEEKDFSLCSSVSECMYHGVVNIAERQIRARESDDFPRHFD